MKPRILLVPDWLGWITGTEAKAIKAYNAQFDCDIVPMAALRHAIGCGWKPELDFDAVHLFTTETVREFGPRFLGKLPTVTSMHHIHDEADGGLDVSGDAIMTGSSPWETDLIRRGVPREKFIRLAYGVDCWKFRPPSGTERLAARRSLGLRHNEVAVGFVGKKGSDNVGRKGFDIYCKAIRQLVMAGVPCVALVWGSGWQDELRKSLPSAVRHIHLPYMKDPSLIYRAMDFY